MGDGVARGRIGHAEVVPLERGQRRQRDRRIGARAPRHQARYHAVGHARRLGQGLGGNRPDRRQKCRQQHNNGCEDPAHRGIVPQAGKARLAWHTGLPARMQVTVGGLIMPAGGPTCQQAAMR
ncbi:hypothetical protein D3C72_1564200 [compost metagenome]